jgi:NIPSNAP
VSAGPYPHFGVIELRRYALRPGMRDELIALFEREFIETQEACGMVPIGHYRDLDDPDSFVWLRGFADMERRRGALEAFYVHSQAWRDHRDAANATMIDSDNVLLLRNARPSSGFDLNGLVRDDGNGTTWNHFVAVSVLMLDTPAGERFIAQREAGLLPALRLHASRMAYFVTEDARNDFPRLPVREGEWAFIIAGVCPDRAALDAWVRTMEHEGCETLRLVPAPRALFR